MILDEILERNRVFVRGRQPRPFPPAETIPLAVVACYDPRLDDLLLPALGLRPAQAFLLRTAGALVQPQGGVMRSLAMGVFLFHVSRIVVVGHSSCRMADFDTSRFIDSFRRRGVSRDAFGTDDLRTWAGAIASPARGVQLSMANISAAPFLPSDLTVEGLVLDDATGELTLVHALTTEGRASDVVAAASEPLPRPAVPALEISAAPPALEPEPEVEPVPSAPAPASAVAPSGLPASLSTFSGPLGTFLAKLESQARWKEEVLRLRVELSRQKNPIRQFALLENFARRASAESSEVGRAFEELKAHLRSSLDSGLGGEVARQLKLRLGGARR